MTSDEAIINVFGEDEGRKLIEWKKEMDKRQRKREIFGYLYGILLTIFLIMIVFGGIR